MPTEPCEHFKEAAQRRRPPLWPAPYSVPPLQKPYSDYEWDDSYPGTLKPGTLKENIDLDEAFEMWEGRENANMSHRGTANLSGTDRPVLVLDCSAQCDQEERSLWKTLKTATLSGPEDWLAEF